MALAAIGVFIWRHREELTSAATISPFYLALCALSTAGYLTADGLLTYVIVRRLGGGIRLLECLSLSVTSTGTNILMPVQLGTVGRALYLKQRHNFDYSAFLATIFATQVLMVIVSSMYAAAALAWMLFVEHRPGLDTLLAISVFCVVISVLACFLPRLSIKGHWILNRITEVAAQFYCLRAQPVFVAYLGALAGLKVGAVILVFWTACAGIGVGLSFVEAVGVEALGNSRKHNQHYARIHWNLRGRGRLCRRHSRVYQSSSNRHGRIGLARGAVSHATDLDPARSILPAKAGADGAFRCVEFVTRPLSLRNT